MKRFVNMAACLAGLLVLLLSAQASAAQKSTFVVLPFKVQGPESFGYLERSIPEMLTSRLFLKGRVEPAAALPSSARPIAGEAEAAEMLARYKADYVIWGTVTVIGEVCSLDVVVRDKSGQTWPQAREARAPQLIAAISGVSDAINRDVFGRAPMGQSAGGGTGTGRPINQMSPDIQINQTTSQDVYLNPQFRYSGSSSEDDSRLRSQPLNFPSIGMEVVDADGDGKAEIFLLQDRTLGAYRFNGARLDQLSEFKFPANNQCLNVRSIAHPSGRPWIIVTTVDQRGQPLSYVFTFNGSFKVEMQNIKYYLNVVKLAPAYKEVVVGQQAMLPRLFRPGVYEMMRQGDTLVHGKKLDLPSEANVFNFTYLPGSRGERGSEKLMVLTENEYIRTYGPNGNRMGSTTEKYSGSATGLEMSTSMPGLHRDDVTLANMFYIPMRMIAADIEHDGNWELIVNKPISTASEIFDRYRFFPQAEIHSLYWDGLGLNLQWKTRRIKGSMVDYTLADANNDGIPDLVVCLNTHPGALGVKSRKTVVVLYPLSLDRVDPATRPDTDEMP